MWKKFVGWWKQDRLRAQLTIFFVVMLILVLLPDIFYSVYPGQAAVVWKRFRGGTDVSHVHGEGMHIKWPWDKVYIYDIRLQEVEETYDVLSADGLHVEVDISVRFRPIEEHLGLLHRNVGPNYVKTILLPTIGALAREKMSQYAPSMLYSEKRERVEAEILDRLKAESPVTYIIDGEPQKALHAENVFIRSIKLPPIVANAIDEKLAQRHKMLEYDYRISKEEKEKERKRIEAEGIRIFQDTVTEGISEKYLQWKGIDATLKLAESNNSKVVIIGAGEGGLPVILGGLDSVAPDAPEVPVGGNLRASTNGTRKATSNVPTTASSGN